MPYQEFESGSSTVQKNALKEPPEYKVILLNDDFTTMEFVVLVLQRVFHLDFAKAEKIMLSVHKTGSGVAGVYTYDIAATRAEMAVSMARKEGFPLRVELQKV